PESYSVLCSRVEASGVAPHLRSLPTRRSSDLDSVAPSTTYEDRPGRWVGEPSWPSSRIIEERYPLGRHRIFHPEALRDEFPKSRSEEHTSELQSRFDLVCRLLLAKKRGIDGSI